MFGLALSRARAEGPAAVDVTCGVRIPLRDGVELNATLYRPAAAKEPLPVVFTLTPYVADTYHDRADYFAKNGYVFALVDARGRGNSGGAFEPFANEGRDGHDVVEWLAAQPFSNGKVAMWGGSYAGFDQWVTLAEFPPHLSTIVPAAAAHAGVDFPFFKNVFYPYDTQWLTFTSGATSNGKLFGESGYWLGKFLGHLAGGRPFAELDRFVGNPSPVFQKWLANPTQGPYWDAMTPQPAQYAKFAIPILTITGHYDDDQPGAMTYYRRHMKDGKPDGISRHFLLIGPWDHAGTRTPKAEFGGLRFDEKSVLDLNRLHREWYDWTMKGGPKPAFLEKRVAYYVMGPGAEMWKYADSLEEVTRSKRTIYLHSEGAAGDVFHSGELSSNEPVATMPPDRFTYDPLDTRYAALEVAAAEDPNGLTSQLHALNRFGNGVLYHTAPSEEATEISGSPRAVLYISMDVPDTDLLVSLYEIRPDGSSVALGVDLLRARYRESLREEKPVPPGEIVRYEFDAFPFVSRLVSKGSRLRFVVNCADTLALQRNRNSGGVVAEETGASARTAHVSVHHDAAHASRIEIPIGG
jgi:predicted acyl esterase